MFILENVPLSGYSTMRLGGPATYLTEIQDRFEIAQVVQWAEEHHAPLIMIGGGSNIIWRDEGFKGLVVVNKIMGFDVVQQDQDNSYITIGAGEDWDSVVKRVVEMGLSGIEQLSLIPGTAGATPIQNVGAYGREIADVLTTIEAFDISQKKLVTIPAMDCGFGYRTSRFKTTDKGKYLISSITLHLTHTNPQPPFYRSLGDYLHEHGIAEFTPQSIRDAVIAIRSSKLPDPAKVANNGSFFHNPLIDATQFNNLIISYPEIPHWRAEDDKIKISAAWLVEQAGFKNVHDEETGMATWEKQPLVLVNEKATSTANLLLFKQKIVDAVEEKFNITLQQEPELISSS